jgi:hypothetical protein
VACAEGRATGHRCLPKRPGSTMAARCSTSGPAAGIAGVSSWKSRRGVAAGSAGAAALAAPRAQPGGGSQALG